MNRFRSILIRVHVCVLVFVVLNFAIEEIFGYRFHSGTIFYLKVILYVTGALLFLNTSRPFRPVAVYFSYYALTSVILSLFFIFGGIWLALITSIVVYPISPKPLVYQDNTIKIYESVSGFMDSCCRYDVVQPKLLVFERRLGHIRTEKPIVGSIEYILDKNSLLYKHSTDNSEEYENKGHIETEILYFQ